MGRPLPSRAAAKATRARSAWVAVVSAGRPGAGAGVVSAPGWAGGRVFGAVGAPAGSGRGGSRRSSWSSMAAARASGGAGSTSNQRAMRAAFFVAAAPQGDGEFAQGGAAALAEAQAQGFEAVQVVAHAHRHAGRLEFAEQPQQQGRQGVAHRRASSSVRAR